MRGLLLAGGVLTSVSLGCSGGGTTGSSSARLTGPSIVISQVYGGGGNSGATFTHDFIELFNRSSSPVSLAGWSLQYASATGSFSASATQITELPAVTLAPGHYLLIQQAQGTGGTTPLPTPDFVDPTPIALSGTTGKVALVSSVASLNCNSSATCAGVAASIVDLVGYGTAGFFEGSGAAPGTQNATAALRAGAGCSDSDDNAADFTVSAPIPRNSVSAAHECGLDDGGSPADTGGDGSGGAGAGGGGKWGGDAGPPTARIHDIQGRAHLSPLANSTVGNVPGVVTAVSATGFFMQDPSPDSDDATSEGIFVFTSSAPSVSVGDAVAVTGPISEYRPGCTPSCAPSDSAYPNLTTTEINRPTAVTVSSHGNPLPAPIILGSGSGERRPPARSSKTIRRPTSSSTKRRSIRSMTASISTRAWKECACKSPTRWLAARPRSLAAGAARSQFCRAEARSRRRVPRAEESSSPQRTGTPSASSSKTPSSGTSMPLVNVGASFPGATVGVLDYAFANYKLLPTVLPAVNAGALVAETLSFGNRSTNDIDIASFNVENLDPTDPPAKFTRLAEIAVNNLGAPDLLALSEIQDNDGPTASSQVAATQTLSQLAGAIVNAGGPTYQYRLVNPENNQDGGEPNGNIRVAFFYRTNRGLAFVDRPGAVFNTANSVVNQGGKAALAYSPGRIAPTDGAFANSRKPLAGEFTWKGQTLFVVANHFNSKGGDHPLYGRLQPPAQSSQTQRSAQAQLVAGFVGQILAVEPGARVMVLGDLNDFEFSSPLNILKAAGLTALIETLPPAERYSYVYQGNSQALDHILVSPSMLAQKTGFDVVHVNSEFADQASDHDPNVVRFTVPPPAPAPALPVPATIALSAALLAAGHLLSRRRAPLEGSLARRFKTCPGDQVKLRGTSFAKHPERGVARGFPSVRRGTCAKVT